MVKDTKTKNVKAKSKSNTKTKSITTKDNIKNNLLSDKLYKKGERLYNPVRLLPCYPKFSMKT